MGYADYTTNDSNPIKRYIHQKRLSDSVWILKELDTNYRGSFLDFGGGNGELCKRLSSKFPQASILCYEPSQQNLEEAARNLRNCQNVTLTTRLNEYAHIRFDYIFCLEVFEHLPDQQTLEALSSIENLLEQTGIGVVGIPYEIFLPALLKGIFRMMKRRSGGYETNFPNIISATLGFPPSSRPISRKVDLPYHIPHLGFDHRALYQKLNAQFKIIHVYGSPFKYLGRFFNSEIYFIFRKKQDS